MNSLSLSVPVPATRRNVRYVLIQAPVRYEEEDMPNDFPGRIGQMWRCYVDILTGEWFLSYVGEAMSMSPQVAHSLYMKVCDEGHYTFFDEKMKPVGEAVEDYVPGFFPGEHYGDYLIFEMEAGRITNWEINQQEWDAYWAALPTFGGNPQ